MNFEIQALIPFFRNYCDYTSGRFEQREMIEDLKIRAIDFAYFTVVGSPYQYLVLYSRSSYF